LGYFPAISDALKREVLPCDGSYTGHFSISTVCVFT